MMMTTKPLSRINDAGASQPGVSRARSVWNETQARPGDDQIVFRRWRLGFFVFYSAMALLLGALAVIADRPGTSDRTATTSTAAIASAETITHSH
jgi:hypothetical protein